MSCTLSHSKSGKRRSGPAVSGLAGLICLLGLGTQALAQDGSAFVEAGRLEYERNCAACHGPEGRGDGPVAEVLTAEPTDLTQISAKFSGTFPRDFLFEFIDGRNMINPHGDRSMPIWGPRFMVSSERQAAAAPWDVDARAVALGRMTALVDYIASIQEE
ncbi:c-type cytochrome [Salipiger mucosus]|uniref:Cytochrome c domain-containing protein n=1 Tax=Salipiger mucosus DSM 16094 TaxID=1123237 RepID=S9R068_9RHOB|nr:cytochrome c [Salipiger mucosus]EPX85252.1 hypothetical protein Salmuc_02631 [Salipiger mucosus DSM 16094]